MISGLSRSSAELLVSVCICTFKRSSIRYTLESILAQQLPRNVEIEIVVVDNDPECAGKSYVEKALQGKSITYTYLSEPVPNIAHARNAAIEKARGDWIALIDDDETADPDWISRLVDCATNHKADVVMGLVEPQFINGTPDWIIQGRFFQRSLPPNGTSIRDGRTGNALIAGSIIRNGMRFDPDFGRTGGEDTDFFERILASGRRMVSCPEAIVREIVPKERASMNYLFMKSWRAGGLTTRLWSKHKAGSSKISYCLANMVKLIVSGIAALTLLPFGRSWWLPQSMRMLAQLGKLVALCTPQNSSFNRS